MPGRSGAREGRGEIVVAVMVLSATIGAAVVAGFGPGMIPDDPVREEAVEAGRSAEELIGVLEERAERIAAALETDAARAARKPTRDKLVVSFPPARPREEPEARVPTPGARDTFLALHRRHVEALRKGHHFAAHEIHREIQRLLAGAEAAERYRGAPKAAIARRGTAEPPVVHLYLSVRPESLLEPDVELSFTAVDPWVEPPALACGAPRRAWETPGCGEPGRDHRVGFRF